MKTIMILMNGTVPLRDSIEVDDTNWYVCLEMEAVIVCKMKRKELATNMFVTKWSKRRIGCPN